jgi:TrbC/VIRB2 family pilin
MRITKVFQLTTPAVLMAGSAYAATSGGPLDGPLQILEGWMTGNIAYALGITAIAIVAFLIVMAHEFASVFAHLTKIVMAIALLVGGVLAMSTIFPTASATVSNQPSTGSIVAALAIAVIVLAFIAMMVYDAVRWTSRAVALVRTRLVQKA